MELSSTFLLIAPSWARNMETTFVVKNVLLFFSFLLLLFLRYSNVNQFFFLSCVCGGDSGGSGWWCKMVGAGEGSNTERKKKEYWQ